MSIRSIIGSNFWRDASHETYRRATDTIAYTLSAGALSLVSFVSRAIVISQHELQSVEPSSPYTTALGILAVGSGLASIYGVGRLSELTVQRGSHDAFNQPSVTPQLSATISVPSVFVVEHYPSPHIEEAETRELR